MDSDPPILVGGGGSTLIWIRKDQQPHPIDPATLPDPPNPNAPEKPKHPDQYDCFILSDLTVGNVRVHDGSPGPPNPVPHPVHGKKHFTLFE